MEVPAAAQIDSSPTSSPSSSSADSSAIFKELGAQLDAHTCLVLACMIEYVLCYMT